MSPNDRPTSNTSTPTMTLSGPDDLVAELPGVLGYHPTESLVAVLTQDRTMRCVLRIDLGDFDEEIAERILMVANRAEADTVFAVVYSEFNGPEMPHQGQIEDMRDVLDESGLALVDVLLVDRGRYWSYLCEDPGCCPPEGRSLRGGTPILEAERVRQGLPAVAATRRAAASAYRVRPDIAPTRAALDAAQLLLARPLESRCRVAVEAVRSLAQLLAEGQLGLDPVDDQLDMQAIVQPQHRGDDGLHVRDLVLGTLAAAPGDLDESVEVFIRAANSAPDYLRPRVAGTAAALLAADGSNPVALWAMVDLAEDESLAALVRTGVEQGFPPDLVRETFAEALPMVRERIAAT